MRTNKTTTVNLADLLALLAQQQTEAKTDKAATKKAKTKVERRTVAKSKEERAEERANRSNTFSRRSYKPCQYAFVRLVATMKGHAKCEPYLKDAVVEVIKTMAEVFAKDNPRFKKDMFYAECGLTAKGRIA